MKVAIVCDWLTNLGGAERVTATLHDAFPEAPLYTSVYNRAALPQFADLDVRTSFLQGWPLARTRHQLFPMLRARAFESFDFTGYDVVISSSSAESKGIITRPDTLHIGYVLTPPRYYWSEYQRYLRDPGFGRISPLVKRIAPYMVPRARLWDFVAAQRPDLMVAISSAVARRITKYYRRDAQVLYPPVELDRFTVTRGPRHGFVVVSRLTGYKRVDLAVLACKQLDVDLTVVGRGPELPRLQQLAGPKTRFVTDASDDQVTMELSNAKGFLFPGEEDFGITPLEAQASGTPVVAFAAGGALETVVDGEHGVLFSEQTVDGLARAIERLLTLRLDPDRLRAHAAGFDESVFIGRFRELVDSELARRREARAVE